MRDRAISLSDFAPNVSENTNLSRGSTGAGRHRNGIPRDQPRSIPRLWPPVRFSAACQSRCRGWRFSSLDKQQRGGSARP
jgi:hypothetical protein